ncbi:MAG TPA: alpha/beta fold hydrolase [Usitatibacter sp.]|nr:alpha/beta fold hydrolase [Usitatibacter sp.]
MLARLILASQLVELAAYLALGAWLHRRFGMDAIFLAGSAVALALAARLAIVLAAFAVSWANRTPRQSGECLGLAGSARLVLREWRAMLVLNLVSLPWERLVMPADEPPARGDRPAVLLVHGYFVNRGSFRILRKRLHAAGVGPLFTPNLRSWLAPIEALEEGIARQVERLAAATGRKVVIVAHSMGGLATRLMLQRRGDAYVERVISIASPHHGTALARLGVGENARQMRPGSAFLAALQQAEGARGPPVPFTSIYSTHDNLVAPQATSRLPWARNVALVGRGHIDILASDELMAVLRKELGPG